MSLRGIAGLLFVALAFTTSAASFAGQRWKPPRPIAELTTEQLWHVSWHGAALSELVACRHLRGDAPERRLQQVFGDRKRSLEARLGPLNGRDKDIIAMLPPCSYVRGSIRRYDQVLDELERRSN